MLNFYGSNGTKKDGREESWGQKRDRETEYLKGHLNCRTLNMFTGNRWGGGRRQGFQGSSM